MEFRNRDLGKGRYRTVGLFRICDTGLPATCADGDFRGWSPFCGTAGRVTAPPGMTVAFSGGRNIERNSAITAEVRARDLTVVQTMGVSISMSARG